MSRMLAERTLVDVTEAAAALGLLAARSAVA
jgi:hypothetical protein